MKRSHKYIVFTLLAVLFLKHMIPYLQDVEIFYGFTTIRTNVFWAIIFFLSIEMLDAEWGKWKHESDKIMADNIGSSITSSKKDVESLGSWIAFRLGGLMAVGMAVQGREGTLLTHKSAVKEKEGGVMVEGKAEEYLKEELPPILKKLVDRKNLPSPIYLTTAPNNVERNNEIYIKQREYWMDINKMRDARRELQSELEEDARNVKDLKTDLGGKQKGELQRLKEKLSQDNNNNGD